MNNISIAGNLTKDAEIRHLQNGDAVTSFGLADNLGRDKGAIFWNCSLFGKRGEALAQYLTKGTPVTVSGSITEREWVDKEGHTRKSMDVRVNDVALHGGRKDAGAPQKAPQANAPSSGFDDMDSDVPF